ncbi:MAG: DNA starvation/stationary phase protection protein [Hyphomonadaceae bacterium]|nr:MAG: starvation-inducible DNA-binding protein [Caulobacteraceae bacterium]MBT9446771.1 DNA starvation/stationary phase protection protein [Hyphomonadaceae bacterium]TPW03550.1 MAG: starvation-inducible DNA-binding protein [Alphaproteobacteria bacterium]
MEPDIGIGKKKREAVADALAQALADTYALYQKTHLYHWNVQGPRFGPLHALFGVQYNELWVALDPMAERIRALGVMAPTHGAIAKRSTVVADNDAAPSEDAMLRALLVGNETLVKSARAALEVADDAGDQATADLMTERCAAGEKAAWMLRAHLAA